MERKVKQINKELMHRNSSTDRCHTIRRPYWDCTVSICHLVRVDVWIQHPIWNNSSQPFWTIPRRSMCIENNTDSVCAPADTVSAMWCTHRGILSRAESQTLQIKMFCIESRGAIRLWSAATSQCCQCACAKSAIRKWRIIRLFGMGWSRNGLETPTQVSLFVSGSTKMMCVAVM